MLQPRVTPSLPVGREGSLFQRIFSSLSGIDPYASAVSDVYQDLFGEGSYAGKGIYDVDAFEAALAGRVPDSTLLSHDLFEGIFARAGLASDVEVVEEFPARYDVGALRHHRWARGDWQLLPWILGRGPIAAGADRNPAADPGDRPLEDARQSAPHAVGAARRPGPARRLAAAASRRRSSGRCSSLATIVLPPHRSRSSPPSRRAARASRSPATCARSAATCGSRSTLSALIDHLPGAPGLADGRCDRPHAVPPVRQPPQPARMGSGRAGGSRPRRLDLAGFYRRMAGAPGDRRRRRCSLAWSSGSGTWPLAGRFRGCCGWPRRPSRAGSACRRSIAGRNAAVRRRRAARCGSPRAAPGASSRPSSRRPTTCCRPTISRKTRRRRWRTAPRRPISVSISCRSSARATSAGSAPREAVERLEATLATMSGMERFRGHFYNWYDTRDLRPLDPQLRLVGRQRQSRRPSDRARQRLPRMAHRRSPIAARVLAGIADAVDLAREEAARLRDGPPDADGDAGASSTTRSPRCRQLVERAARRRRRFRRRVSLTSRGRPTTMADIATRARQRARRR